MKKFLKIVIILLLILLLGIASLGVYGISLNKTTDTMAREVTFSVMKGESLNSVADRLQQEGIIHSALLLKLISKVKGTETLLKAGYYYIPSEATTMDIHNILVSGKQKLFRITIPEGWTRKKIALHLEEKNICQADEFVAASDSKELLEEFEIPGANFEGYLFPDTYYFAEKTPADQIIKAMVRNFFNKLTEVAPEVKDMNRNTIFRKIIMASIIEREYRVAEEATRIASVFYNRLKYSVGLESCATLEYIITDIQNKPHPKYITYADKEIDSLYNTYKWHGLPPGPISNPGRVALNASFHPADTDYWFFLLKDPAAGTHYFSKDLEEHIQAKFYYLKGYGAPPE